MQNQLLSMAASLLPWSDWKRERDAGVKPLWDEEFGREQEKPLYQITKDPSPVSNRTYPLCSHGAAVPTAAAEGDAKCLAWQSEGGSADRVTVVTHPLARGGWQWDTGHPCPPEWQHSGVSNSWI